MRTNNGTFTVYALEGPSRVFDCFYLRVESGSGRVILDWPDVPDDDWMANLTLDSGTAICVVDTEEFTLRGAFQFGTKLSGDGTRCIFGICQRLTGKRKNNTAWPVENIPEPDDVAKTN